MIARLESFIDRFLPKGSAMRHISIIAGGTTIAQIINITTTPVLSRIYLPEDFGVMAAFLSVIAILNEATGLRYPLAIPLPKHDRYADALIVLCFLIQFVLVMLVAFLLFTVGGPLLTFLSLDALIPYRLLIPVGVACVGIYFTLSQWAIRAKSFSTIARTKLTQSVSGVIAKVTLGILGFHPLGLLLGSIVSQAGGATTLLRSLLKKCGWPKTSRRDLKKVALRYRRFPIFSTWSGVMITLGGRIAPILLVAFFDTHVAGLFAMAQSLLYIPSAFVGQSIRPVFLQRSSTAKHDGNLDHVFRKASKILMRISFFPILLIAFFAPWLLRMFLGVKWQAAGTFAQIIAPWVAINFVFSPLSSIFSVLERQRAGLIFEIVHLPLRIIALFLGARINNVVIAIIFLTIVNSGIYLIKLGYLYLATGNSIVSFLRDFTKEASFAILLCILPVLGLQMSLGVVAIVFAVLLPVVYYLRQLFNMLYNA